MWSDRTPETAALLGELAELVVRANIVYERQRLYTMEYYAGQWIWVRWRPWVYIDGVTHEVVARDTQVTEENLKAAIETMRREITEEANG